ncbi:MAG: phosphate ABC transporter substrate-binding protein PstS [Candidatus Krumholzibacteriia bacterium]
MKKLLVGLSLLALPAGAAATKINGAGATFPYPVYSQWAYRYKNLTGDQINYQSIGSGGGIAQITAKTVHFGASDAPLAPEKLEENGLIQFPMVMGGVVPVVNVPGVAAGDLRLTPGVLAGIYLGNITKWNDEAIRSINPRVGLPDKSITVVHRADGSGTTWIFTNYLKKVSREWNDQVGFGKAVDWPAGIGGKGNEGVAAYVQRVKGSIGYVEFAYALQNKMTHTLLQNGTGAFVSPTIETFQAAAANAEWQDAKGFYLVLTDQPGEHSWPITGATFILIHKEQADAGLAKAMLEYFDWCYRHGGDVARDLHYVPMPGEVVEMVQATWRSQIKSGGAPVWSVATRR